MCSMCPLWFPSVHRPIVRHNASPCPKRFPHVHSLRSLYVSTMCSWCPQCSTCTLWFPRVHNVLRLTTMCFTCPKCSCVYVVLHMSTMCSRVHYGFFPVVHIVRHMTTICFTCPKRSAVCLRVSAMFPAWEQCVHVSTWSPHDHIVSPRVHRPNCVHFP